LPNCDGLIAGAGQHRGLADRRIFLGDDAANVVHVRIVIMLDNFSVEPDVSPVVSGLAVSARCRLLRLLSHVPLLRHSSRSYVLVPLRRLSLGRLACAPPAVSSPMLLASASYPSTERCDGHC
jgi:hypothetical protein